MGVNKVVLGGNTLMDITSTTATVSDVSTGKYFYDIDGNRVEGTGTITSEYPIGGSLTDCTCTGYVIPSSTTKIKDYMFENCTLLSSIDLKNVKTVGINSFYKCSSLTSLTGNMVESAGKNSFNGCSLLESVSLPKATTLGENSFYQCTSLVSAHVPEVTSLVAWAFRECSALNEVDLYKESKTLTVGDRAFQGCSRLTEIDFRNVSQMGQLVFYECDALDDIKVSSGIKIKMNSTYASKIATIQYITFLAKYSSSSILLYDNEEPATIYHSISIGTSWTDSITGATFSASSEILSENEENATYYLTITF